MDILEDSLFKAFIQNRGIRKGTITRYNTQLKMYCNFIGKTPTELIDEAEKEDLQIRMRNKSVKKYLLDFKDYMETNNYSSHNITNTLTMVRTFYTEYDIMLPKMQLKRKHNVESVEDIPSKNDIKLALKNCNPKFQAIILLMSSSGMGSAEVRSLSYKAPIRILAGVY